MQEINIFTRSLRAETIKLKKTPIIWVIWIGSLFLSGFIFLIHFFNVEEFTAKQADPWLLYLDLSFIFMTMLFLIPYVVLLAGSVVYPEHDSNAWKYLYALPLKKGHFYFSKLLMILFLLALTYIIFLVSTMIGAYLLDLIYPEFGFSKYTPLVGNYLQRLAHSFISMLAIVGLHYWLSVRWKSFILPIGIGLLGFIVATFLVFIGSRFDLAAYFPYAYPQLIGAEFGKEPIGLEKIGWFTKVELYSIALFLLFSLVGFYEEQLRNVK